MAEGRAGAPDARSGPRPSGAHRPRVDARAVAMEALCRIDDGAYANIVVPQLLDRSALTAPDRRLTTELVYGTTRMRRACDWLVDRFLMRDPDAVTRAALRLGAYQIEFLGTPAYAAVAATVAVAPPRTRGLVNAVLRKVAEPGHRSPAKLSSPSGGPPPRGPGVTRRPEVEEAPGNQRGEDAGAGSGRPTRSWPSNAVRLSYPDWIVERLCADLGSEAALGALAVMDEAPSVTTREDGYIQDVASQLVARAVGAQAGDTIADLCAAPGGKATALATAGVAVVVAIDVRPARARMMAATIERLGTSRVAIVIADSARPPLRPASFDRVLVDAPCSGLGVLRRRPDARWRVEASDVNDLVKLQRRLLHAAAELVRPGGVLLYSVCTLTAAETLDNDTWMADAHPDLDALAPPGAPWVASGRGALLLPQALGTDGMYLLRLSKPATSRRHRPPA